MPLPLVIPAVAGAVRGSKGLWGKKGRERRRKRREGDQDTVAAPELGRDFAAEQARMGGLSGTSGAAYGTDRAQQAAALDAYRRAASGNAPSQAQLMLQQQTAANVGNFQSAIAGGRGGNMAAQGRQMAAMSGAAQMGGQQQIAQLRAQEMEAARAGQATLASTMAGQSSDRQMQAEQMRMGGAGMQLDADLSQRGLNIGQRDSQAARNQQWVMAGSKGVDSAVAAGKTMSDERVKTDISQGESASEAEASRLSAAPQPPQAPVEAPLERALQGLVGLFHSAQAPGGPPQQPAPPPQRYSPPLRPGSERVGSPPIEGPFPAAQQIGHGAFSDERVKTDVGRGDVAASEAMAELKPSTYQYASPEYGPGGQKIGIMAQDLEKTPAGSQLVQNTPAGKQVDVAGGMSLALASGADQEKRIRELEAALAQGGGGLASTGQQYWQQARGLPNLPNGEVDPRRRNMTLGGDYA